MEPKKPGTSEKNGNHQKISFLAKKIFKFIKNVENQNNSDQPKHV